MKNFSISTRKDLLKSADFEMQKIRESISKKNELVFEYKIQNVQDVMNKMNKDDSLIDLLDKLKLSNDRQSFQEDSLIGGAEYHLHGWLKIFYDEIPDEIKKSRFMYMSLSEISDYAKKNEKQRKELQKFMKKLYDWSFIKENSGLKSAELIRKSFDKRIKEGLTEEEIYDWYYNNSEKAKTFQFIAAGVIIGSFLLKLWFFTR